MSSEIKLNDILPAIDRKNRKWWDGLSDEQRDKFSSWIYMRYGATVEGNADLSRYYLIAFNEIVNKRFNVLKNHPKLQFMLMTAASPGMGTVRHTWLAPMKKGKANKRIKLLEQLYPNANSRELELLAEINGDDDIKAYLQDLGWTDKDIKAAMKGTKDE